MRPISLWVCNMSKEPICLIYDSELELYNTVFDVTITTQRNGSKVLDFSMRDSGEDEEPLLNLLGMNKEIETVRATTSMRLGSEWVAACNNLPRGVPISWHRNVVNKTRSYTDSIRLIINGANYSFYSDGFNTLPEGEVTEVRLYYNSNQETSTETQYYTDVRFSYSSEDYKYNKYNWRLGYLVPEYFIKATTEEGDDYFIITNDSISHNKRSKQISVSCQHGAMLLKYMCLDKEYDGTEEKCIGTAQQLMESVLDGTTWTYDAAHSDTFYEKKIFGDNIEKKRTLKASMKTGAFGIISKIADLFEAKPIYNADSKTVILRKMNPFEIDINTGLPTITANDTVLELNYGYNVKNVTRTRNTESMVTRLNVQGAFGDTTLGYCGIEETKAYKHVLKASAGTATTYKFTVNDAIDNKVKTYYVFMSGHATSDVLEFYMFDRASESYLWNATKSVAYKILPTQTIDIAANFTLSLLRTEEIDPRLFNFLMDFTYYRENHMMSDAAIQKLAEFQVNGRSYLQTIKEKTATYNTHKTELEKVIGDVVYNKVAIDNFSTEDGYLKINLDLTNYPDNGIIYTTEIDELRRNWFTWRPSTLGIDKYGDALTSGASVVYLVHNTMGYERLFIKSINYTDSTNKVISSIVLWTNKTTFIPSNYQLFIFKNSTTGGLLSARESEIEGFKNQLITATTYCGIYHPTYWEDDNELVFASVPTDYWAWKIIHHKSTETNSDMYCCCPALFSDNTYRPCITTRVPEPFTHITSLDAYDYLYNYGTGNVWVKLSGTWTKVYDENETYTQNKVLKERFKEEFILVCNAKLNVDCSIIGLYEKYRTTVTSASGLAKDSHIFITPNPYYYILFTPDVTIQQGKYLEYNTDDNYIYTDQVISPNSNILTTKVIRYDAITKYKANEIISFSPGAIDDSGSAITSTEKQRTGYFTVYGGQPYVNISPDGTDAIEVYLYNKAKTFTRKVTLNRYGRVTISLINGEEFCRVVTANGRTVANTIFQRLNYQLNCLYKAGGVFTNFTWGGDWDPIGDKKGLVTQFNKFLTYTDLIYNPETGDLKQIKEAQDAYNAILEDMVDALGPIYKQGYWSDSQYVDGDEERLLADAFENLDEIAKPKTTYQVQFVDLYNVEHQKFLYALADSNDMDWPDITINTAIHLIDDELNIQQWAYLDSLKKCYDDPRKTQITINTNLSDIAQATFQDVMQNIVSVADETKYKADIYNRAESLSSKGVIAEKISGSLSTGVTTIESSDSSWTTDERGNIMFKSTNGSGRMKITGDGLLVAASVDEYGKPIWRTAITGTGISADEITTGTLKANVIEAGGITTSQLSSTVGEELVISSNASILLCATVDGSRSAGSVDVIKESVGSIIKIDKERGIDILSGGNIDIESGAEVNVKGSTVNIEAAGSTNPTINMTAGTMNLAAESQMNITSANGIDVTGNGNITVSSGGTFRAQNSTSGSYIEVDGDGVDIVGSNINLAASGFITLCDGNTISNQGILSLHDGDMIINGADGTITTTANADIIAGGDINLNAATSKLNATAGEVNISGTAALNATGGAVNITSGSTLDIDSDNFKVVSSTGAVEVNGTIYAQAGKIGCDSSKTGGWDITKDRLTSGTGTYNVTLSSDTSIKPSDVNEWNATTDYVAGDIVKVTTGTAVRYYKATLASKNKKPGTTAGSGYWEEAEEWFAIWAGGTKATDAPFRVARDGSVYLNSLWTVNPNDPSAAATKIDLSAAVWKLTYSTIMSNTKDDGGTYTKEITLSDSTITRDKILKFNNVSSYKEEGGFCTEITLSEGKTLNFSGAGAIKNYIFSKVGDITNGIEFNVTGVKTDGTPIAATTHGPYPLTLIGEGSAASLYALFTAKAATSSANEISTNVKAYPDATVNQSNDTFTINSQIKSEPGESQITWAGKNTKTMTLGIYLPAPSGTPPTSIDIKGKLTYDSTDHYSTATNIYPAYTLGNNSNKLRVTSSIKSGSAIYSSVQEDKTVTPNITLSGSTLTSSATIAGVSTAFTGTDKEVSVSSTINTSTHTITPTTTIGDLGTVTGTDRTITAEVDLHGGAALASVTVNALAKCDGTQMNSDTTNLYPWALISKASNKIRITGQVRDAASGGGNVLATVNIEDKALTFDLAVLIMGSALASKTVRLNPSVTIDSLTFTGDSIDKRIVSTVTVTGSTSTDHANITTSTTFDDLDTTTTSVDIYPQVTVSRYSNTKFRVINRARQGSTSGSIKAQLVNDYTITPTITVAATTGGATLTPDTTLGSFSYTGTAITATASETHSIDTTTKTIDITPKVTINGTDYNGSSSQINFTANLTATSSSGITTYGANCVVGGQTYTCPTTVSYKQVSITPVGTSHTTIAVTSRGAQVTKSVSVTPIGDTEYYLKRDLINRGYGRWAIWDGGWVEQFYGYCHSGYIQDTDDVYERVYAATEKTITRYTAGTEYTHHPTDKTLYESGDDIVRVLGVTAGDPVYDSGTATTYYEKQ